MICIDCEMVSSSAKLFGRLTVLQCFTKAGLELTRVSVIDEQLKVLYDTLVLPSNPILDYNTR